MSSREALEEEMSDMIISWRLGHMVIESTDTWCRWRRLLSFVSAQKEEEIPAKRNAAHHHRTSIS